MISIDEFKKVEIRSGKIMSAERVEGSEKLLKLAEDFGSATAESYGETRQVISGIATFVTHLEPREIMGLKSEAMIMAVSGEGFFSLLKIAENVPPGSIIK